MSIATVLAEDLNLEIIKPPIKLPKIEIFQYWHNRFYREPGIPVVLRVRASVMQPANVDTVMVDGRILKRNGKLVVMNGRQIAQEAGAASAALRKRANWPI